MFRETWGIGIPFCFSVLTGLGILFQSLKHRFLLFWCIFRATVLGIKDQVNLPQLSISRSMDTFPVQSDNYTKCILQKAKFVNLCTHIK